MVRDDDANLPVNAEHQGQAPAGNIPLPREQTQAEIDRYTTDVATKVNLLGMNMWKTERMPRRG
eukprot:3104879-Alexandrium_andersonii.AAC.1